jgi:hypothetical protein
MEGERKQIEGDHNAGQGLLAVSKIVLKVVSVGLEHVEGLVLDLPPRPAAGGKSATVSRVIGRSVTKLL